MSATPLVRNVTKIFREATEDQLDAGQEWYGRATRLAVELSASLPTEHQHHGDVERAAAVIAVLSPRVSWGDNVAMARQAYRMAGEPWGWLVSSYSVLPTLKSNARKAGRLLCESTPSDEIVSGPKVTAFWRTIADPTDPFAVVVDRHAYDVSVGRVTSDAERTKALLGKRYEGVCDVYRRAARILTRELGRPISPAVVQATTWTVWRESRIRTRYAAAVERATLELAA